MINFINKFKIPTLLGLGIIFLGLGSGLFLVIREQVLLSRAAPDIQPQNITFTNITEDSISISWQTKSSIASFITYGQNNPGEQTALDDRDDPANAGPKPHSIHYVTLKNLLPKTAYQFKIISGKLISDIKTFQTAQPLTNQTGFTPVIGNILNDKNPLDDGIAYLAIEGAVTQSTLIKPGGNFLIPLSQIRKNDLSDIYQLTEGSTAKLTIQSGSGEASASFKLAASSKSLPPIKLGQNIDLTNIITNYDLNGDGKINAADNAIILENFGKKPKRGEVDLNSDGKIDQKDLDLMAQELGNQ